LSAVKTDPVLNRLASEQAQAMAASRHMDHDVKGSFSSRISGYPTNLAAENIAMGNETFQATLEQWKNSSGHRENMLRPAVSRIGIASAGSGHDTYWSLILAAPPTSSRRDVAATKKETTPKQDVAATKKEKKDLSEPKKGILENLISILPFHLGAK
jgi:hypothetical protein